MPDAFKSRVGVLLAAFKMLFGDLFKTFKINKVKVISADDNDIPVKKGDKKIDPASLFGIWANKPRSLENIRKDAWL